MQGLSPAEEMRARELATAARATQAVNLHEAIVSWIKLAPDGLYTRGRLVREVSEEYRVSPERVSKAVQALVRCGALQWEQRDPYKRRHLYRGHLDASRVRVHTGRVPAARPPQRMPFQGRVVRL
jgi:hypothetical protein